MSRTSDSPDRRAVEAATTAESLVWGIKRFADVSLVASDITWTAGAGQKVVAAPAIDLLLIATGRSTGFVSS